jgi:acyl-CoA synthetase (AMP-forming)/AMP-acid ligase II
MTETNGTGASATAAEALTHPGCVGKPLPGNAVRVCAPGSALPCEDGEVGEIQIRSASVFLGYYGDEAATAAARDDQGWYRTGDFGRVTDGLVVLEGRRSDLIKGEKVAAIVVRRPGATVGVDELRGWVGDRLAAFKIPEHLEFGTELPRNALGKTMKHLLRTGRQTAPSETDPPGTSE